MSSSSNSPNPWTPYETLKDCSQGICSMYCPQWCYFIFPPPPAFPIDDDDDDSSTDFSPLIIALIGILASAFILVSYYTIISKYCRRRRQQRSHGTSLDFNENREETNHDGWQTGSQGLDESLIKAISVCKFRKNEGLIEGTDCSVCLSEFMEDESLRLLPKCNHAFHVPCIDTWLKSHSSCPLCRANIATTNQSDTAGSAVLVQEGPRNVGVSAAVYQQRNEAISVIQDLESGVREEAVVTLVVNQDFGKTAGEEAGRDTVALEIGRDGDRIQPLRRSVSMSSSHGRVMSIADVLHISEEDEDELQVEHHLESSSTGIGSSKQFDSSEYCCKSNQRNGVFNLGMKRSISTGRFIFPRFEK